MRVSERWRACNAPLAKTIVVEGGMRVRERWRSCNVPEDGQIAVGCVTGDAGISSNHSARRN